MYEELREVENGWYVANPNGIRNGILYGITIGIYHGTPNGTILIMVTTLTVDKAGRVVLPKPVREELQLAPGDSLELESSEDRIVLRPARGNGRMYKKQGVWVFDSGVPLTQDTVNKTVRRVRRERERQIMGKVR
jgi:AbrB family looped-hinge helix DNA binding protein